jgi:hypothetical protein
MIFGQRMPMSDLAVDAWDHIQAAYVRALSVPAKFWAARGGRLCAWAVENWQVFTAMTVGVLIGSSALAFLTGNMAFTISYVLPLWLVTLLQLLQQQGTAARQGNEQVGQPPGQHQPGMDARLRVMASVADDEAMTALVEDALRHLYDCSYLGQHPLAQLQWMQRRQSLASQMPGMNTHLDVGRALFSLLADMVDQLRPAGVLPTGVGIPPREWHPYMILHGSYVRGELTREIMARLYIGEGTYNRTRRRALRSVTRAIQEIEQQIGTQSGC